MGITPEFEAWNGNGSLVAFVVSLNLHRRHLDAGQRGMIGLKVKPMIADEVAQVRAEKGRHAIQKRWEPTATPDIGLTEFSQTYDDQEAEPEKRDSLAETAQLMGISKDTMTKAQAIERHDPELAAKVVAGEMKLNAA